MKQFGEKSNVLMDVDYVKYRVNACLISGLSHSTLCVPAFYHVFDVSFCSNWCLVCYLLFICHSGVVAFLP